MSENFITDIHIRKSRNIENFDVPLSKDERKHLILTGKNGSGKTSLLLDMKEYFDKSITNSHGVNPVYSTYKRNSSGIVEVLVNNINLYDAKLKKGIFILAFFDAKRLSKISIPQGIKKVDLQKKYNTDPILNQHFLQYIVNMKADRSFARDDEDMEAVQKIDQWFDTFQERLRDIFDNDNLELRFDRKNYTFNFVEEGKEPYGFNTLSDGYSAILSIATELIMRMEAHGRKSYDMEGIVLIDEIESHLHVELQKKIMPFLTGFFPKIQFIVSTHSPFVISSLSNAIIYDLEKGIVASDLSGYSYEALVESYFEVDKYSARAKEQIKEYEELMLKDELSFEERDRLEELEDYFGHLPRFLSKELFIKVDQIKLESKKR